MVAQLSWFPILSHKSLTKHVASYLSKKTSALQAGIIHKLFLPSTLHNASFPLPSNCHSFSQRHETFFFVSSKRKGTQAIGFSLLHLLCYKPSH
ncbi:hypothetical protein RHGRI_005660 [Rhododendron griersonianum]|uniref:Uncharacterized protein n=1 Tax=Rhododendron griersonianum TaxID=479676 RepID=A0AAV6LGG6_9ERIC|nr:hypothetical protein RHGRI_005660 [Rhododendron griersonianum]